MKGVSDGEEGPEWPVQHKRDMTRPRGRAPLTQGIRDPVGIWEHISAALFASGQAGLIANSRRGRIHKKKPPHLHLSPQMQMYKQIQSGKRILTSSLFSIHSVPSENTLLKSESVCLCVCVCVCVCVLYDLCAWASEQPLSGPAFIYRTLGVWGGTTCTHSFTQGPIM